MFESGAYVAESLERAGADLDEEQVQPNGVDLTLGEAFVQTEPGRIEPDGKSVGDRARIDPDAEDRYALEPGAYVVRYGEPVRIPEGHVGFVYPRSSLLRNSCMLNTAVWDAGYEGVGEGLLRVGHDLSVERGARIAQLVLARADHSGTYDGSYQGERL
ncbi:deoxyuridine 5'-triphosphate nucleotidohydrolase [Haloparvum alkalitolerans]|uniref:deoxyuridine 5'-triphosphate nucleotidohydrolase n=1 Tax=Haloparvum alkalitolerans TaxID=1042953 RepID=UPI003CF89AA1